ncbi:hypothetical protein CbuD7D7780_04145 [Coxiella burnetii]|nr:agmatine deiminase family protein [Coxiella burnetii]OYK80467.1 hypothetical protein CbuD7E6568_04125 [Coxiella burnetii]OYK82425.1 hypothetical protein CbuD7D7780_04145 [Coxiella burnetii]
MPQKKSIQGSPSVFYYMPEESAPHQRTWMQWPTSISIYESSSYLTDVRKDLSQVARAIAQFEEVFMLTSSKDIKIAQKLCGPNVQLIEIAVDDMWARDSGPTFVVNDEGKYAIADMHFNGWGNKQKGTEDNKIVGKVAEFCQIPLLDTKLVAEGGAIDVDGRGTLLTTESAIINDNRNPGRNRKPSQRCFG